MNPQKIKEILFNEGQALLDFVKDETEQMKLAGVFEEIGCDLDSSIREGKSLIALSKEVENIFMCEVDTEDIYIKKYRKELRIIQNITEQSLGNDGWTDNRTETKTAIDTLLLRLGLLGTDKLDTSIVLKYPISKKDYLNRCNSLLNYKDDCGEVIIPDDFTIDGSMDEILSQDYQEDNKSIYYVISSMMYHVYNNDLSEEGNEDIVNTWTMEHLGGYSFLCSSFKDFVQECDSFLTHLRVYEIIQELNEIAEGYEDYDDNVFEPNGDLAIYLQVDESIGSLTELNEKIISSFNPESYTDEWEEYYELHGNIVDNWVEIEQEYGVYNIIDQVAVDISKFNGCEKLADELNEINYNLSLSKDMDLYGF